MKPAIGQAPRITKGTLVKKLAAEKSITSKRKFRRLSERWGTMRALKISRVVGSATTKPLDDLLCRRGSPGYNAPMAQMKRTAPRVRRAAAAGSVSAKPRTSAAPPETALKPGGKSRAPRRPKPADPQSVREIFTRFRAANPHPK